jgi:DNA-binding CsgD family transcriptional regulator
VNRSAVLSLAEQASLNLEQAREMRAAGRSYREIGRQLGITSNQLSHIRRTLKREKAGRTRLRSIQPQATDRDLPISRSVLPAGLRQRLTASGYRTLGDLADRLADPDFPGLETMPGIGPHRARLVKRVLDHFRLLAGRDDLREEIERLFPEFGDEPVGTQH